MSQFDCFRFALKSYPQEHILVRHSIYALPTVSQIGGIVQRMRGIYIHVQWFMQFHNRIKILFKNKIK